MTTRREVRIGVGELLNMQFPPDHLGSGEGVARFSEGSSGHRWLAARRGPEYRTEVTVQYPFDWEEYRLVVRGRMDGLWENETAIVVEEIKTTYLSLAGLELSRYQVHEAQLLLYLYFMQMLNPEKQVSGRLTYLNLEDLNEKTFEVGVTGTTGRQLFEAMAVQYLESYREQERWIQTRNASLLKWEFPYDERRPGQDELMELVGEAIRQERDLFAEAATGIGKTVAVLYPALQNLAVTHRFNRIFFFTAKTVGKEILKKTLQQAARQQVRLRTVFIESRERLCLAGKKRCEAETCPYARDYYVKVKPLLGEVLRQELITGELVTDYARQFEVCPFEFTLDLTLQADLIVGDYNYLFDPGVYLRRFFAAGGRDHLFLVDEAHNLVARGREMYSADLAEPDLMRLKRLVGEVQTQLGAAVGSLLGFFIAWREELEDEQSNGLRLRQLPDFFEPQLQRVLALFGEYLSTHSRLTKKEELRQAYFKLADFTRIAAQVDRDYAIYLSREPEHLKLRLLCLNPGNMLRKRLDHGRAAIFFSATLSPQPYFQELLGGKPDALWIRLLSPFPQENRLYLHIPELDTRYHSRNRTMVKLAECIQALVRSHTGNYLVFFPSYSYLQALVPLVKQQVGGEATVYCQTARMSEADKQLFLQWITRTDTGHSQIGLAVLGGMFGEGVDFPGEALVGVMIVGPGLPMVNAEQELIREYFDEKSNQGFFYAYLVPGLIRVIQSAGRVFRRPDDRGVVLLVDDRFGDERYQELLPPDWFMPGRPFTSSEYAAVLADFWGEDARGE